MSLMPQQQISFFHDPSNINTKEACKYLSVILSQQLNMPVSVSQKMIAKAQSEQVIPQRRHEGRTRVYYYTVHDLNCLLADRKFIASVKIGTKRKESNAAKAEAAKKTAKASPRLVQPSFSELEDLYDDTLSSGEERVATTTSTVTPVMPTTPHTNMGIMEMYQHLLTRIDGMDKALADVNRTTEGMAKATEGMTKTTEGMMRLLPEVMRTELRTLMKRQADAI